MAEHDLLVMGLMDLVEDVQFVLLSGYERGSRLGAQNPD
jgi:hypothetical protein